MTLLSQKCRCTPQWFCSCCLMDDKRSDSTYDAYVWQSKQMARHNVFGTGLCFNLIPYEPEYLTPLCLFGCATLRHSRCWRRNMKEGFNDWGGRGYVDFVLGEVNKTAPSGDRTTWSPTWSASLPRIHRIWLGGRSNTSPVGAIFVPSPPKTGKKLLHPRPPQSLNGSKQLRAFNKYFDEGKK